MIPAGKIRCVTGFDISCSAAPAPSLTTCASAPVREIRLTLYSETTAIGDAGTLSRHRRRRRADRRGAAGCDERSAGLRLVQSAVSGAAERRPIVTVLPHRRAAVG